MSILKDNERLIFIINELIQLLDKNSGKLDLEDRKLFERKEKPKSIY